jgi:hypothetical protein
MADIQNGIKRFILWDYPRGVWQYDVMVGLILMFLFLTPRDWFRDQPRIANPSSIVKLPAQHGIEAFWVDQPLLAGVSEAERESKAATLISARTGKSATVLRVQQIVDPDENEVKGYIVHTKP